MNKKYIITPLLTLIAMTGFGQNRASIHGITQPEVKTVYVFHDLSFRKPDSIAVTNGQWEYRPVAMPILQSMRIFISDINLKQQNMDGFVAAVTDTIPTFVDLTTGKVSGLKFPSQ